MAKWRLIHIIGTISAGDVKKLIEILDRKDKENWDWNTPYACLSFDSSKSTPKTLGSWPATRVDSEGNCPRQSISPEQLADAFSALLDIAPSMRLKIYLPGEATIDVDKDWVCLREDSIPYLEDRQRVVRVQGTLNRQSTLPAGSKIYYRAADTLMRARVKWIIKPGDSRVWAVNSEDRPPFISGSYSSRESLEADVRARILAEDTSSESYADPSPHTRELYVGGKLSGI